MSKNHHLKIQEKFYIQIKAWIKTFEIRINDRDYKTGDTITFNILFWENIEKYESDLKLQITDVFQEEGYGLVAWFCILSFKKI